MFVPTVISFLTSDHPGEVQFHVFCNGTEKAFTDCSIGNFKEVDTVYNVGIQCCKWSSCTFLVIHLNNFTAQKKPLSKVKGY